MQSVGGSSQQECSVNSVDSVGILMAVRTLTTTAISSRARKKVNMVRANTTRGNLTTGNSPTDFTDLHR